MVSRVKFGARSQRHNRVDQIDNQPTSTIEGVTNLKKSQRRRKAKSTAVITLIGLLLTAGAVSAWLYLHRYTGPVPKSVAKKVNFPVYYPDPKKLPTGFRLIYSSFSSGDDTVLFSISYGAKKLVVTEQQKPTDQDIQTFYKHQMPIHTQIQTNVGVATVAALNSQNVVSLPTNDKAWLIITYPSQVSAQQLNQVLQSFTK